MKPITLGQLIENGLLKECSTIFVDDSTCTEYYIFLRGINDGADYPNGVPTEVEVDNDKKHLSLVFYDDSLSEFLYEEIVEFDGMSVKLREYHSKEIVEITFHKSITIDPALFIETK